MSSTVDANVLLYASDTGSPYFERALDVVETLAAGPDLVYLFWPTVMAYLRVATHPAIFESPLTEVAATGNVERLLDLPHVRAPGEQDAFWRYYRDTTASTRAVGNLVPDAHLVSLMRENGVRTIWTHDRDYRKFDDVEVRDPFATA